ncbi:hypothetical protein GCM10025868_42240 [Angustibacter aerolatus]|uniref:Uncharacterized protein n=1 Tax=Angustibacter aerolatus TaxID=1162965 RepID=A0ABQ6JNQ7_9ACTN|nr:hypothetical protein GCM10025868_42240 [Angustibacter aerolatus]
MAGLLARDVRGDPLTELTAPDPVVPAGVEVHAVVGACSAEAVERALTAVVASTLAGRSRARSLAAAGAAPTPVEPAAEDDGDDGVDEIDEIDEVDEVDEPGVEVSVPVGTRLGLRVPTGAGSAAGGLRAALGLDADLLRVAADGVHGPRLGVRLRLAGDGRWLVGGPDGARAAGARPLLLRAVSLELDLALGGEGGGSSPPASARLVLHDASAFGVRSPRWVVDLSAAGGAAGALLPEPAGAAGRGRRAGSPPRPTRRSPGCARR